MAPEKSVIPTGGLHPEITLPHEAEVELYHNSLSLCSGKVRVCLAEKGVPFRGIHIHLIETGWYEVCSPEFLAVNPGGTVPVLVHNGHPVYESHDQILYIDKVLGVKGSLSLDSEAYEHWTDMSALLDDFDQSKTMGNCIPLLTMPIFVHMLRGISVEKVEYGLSTHPRPERPRIFMTLKQAGPEIFKSGLKDGVQSARDHMRVHLLAMEQALTIGRSANEPWLCGATFSLADVGMVTIMHRLVCADWNFLWDDLPAIQAYWDRLKARPSFKTAVTDFDLPSVLEASAAHRKMKTEHEWYREAFEGGYDASAGRQS